MTQKKKTKIGAPVKSLKGLEVQYQRELNKLGRLLIKAVREEVFPFLKSSQVSYVIDKKNKLNLTTINDKFNEDNYIIDAEFKNIYDALLKDSIYKLTTSSIYDGIGAQLGAIFSKLNNQFRGTATLSFSNTAATNMLNKVEQSNKKRFNRSVDKVTGINLSSILVEEGLEDFKETTINTNVSLIKSLPEEYLKQVETIVNNGVVSGARYETITKEIVSKTGANKKLINRIKTIARNEISTINSQMTLRRSENLGITEGIFRTSQDERVRKCHKELNGKVYKLKKGAWSPTCKKYIQPGITDINCRCSYSPIIKVE